MGTDARRGRWWARSRGLPPEAYQRWRRSLPEGSPNRTRILAWAATADGFCIGSPAALSWGAEEFVHLGWHQIERGGWNSETGRLSWTRYPEDGQPRSGYLDLVEPARMPELFRERVAATIVLERFVPLTGERNGPGVVISGRRELDGRAEQIIWRTSLSRGLSWTTPGVADLVEQALGQVQREYDTV